ncbi:MAG: thioredoxin [Firmicutes bacterium]|nr:thioredoxin [Bacillota bacterium]
MSNVIALTEQNFEEKVLKASNPVLVDFFADWCGPCKMLSPTIDKLSTELAGKAEVYKLNVDDCMQIANNYEVSSIPTLIVFKNGQVFAKHTGVQNIEQIKQMMSL